MGETRWPDRLGSRALGTIFPTDGAIPIPLTFQMGKHSKNASGAQNAPSYAERRAWKHGTVTERLGKEAVGRFDDCKLTLTKAVDPVCTPDGVLYSREAILENLLAQKKAHKKKLAAYDRHVAEEELQREQGRDHEQGVKAAAFYQQQMGLSDAVIDRMKSESRQEWEKEQEGKQLVSSVQNIKSESQKMKEMRAFWVHGKERPGGRDVKQRVVEKPDTRTRCPATDKPLKLKDLTAVKFALNKDGEYVDPVTRDPLTNKSRLVVLKDVRDQPNVLLYDTYKRVVEAEGGQYNGTKIDTDEGIITLMSGGTGFASTNKDHLQASRHFALGSNQQRGQSAGRSGGRSGLQFSN
jgi:nitric oxide synthase-interacting protein